MEKAYHDESKDRQSACRSMDRNNDTGMHNRRLCFDKNHKCSGRNHKSILHASKNLRKILWKIPASLDYLERFCNVVTCIFFGKNG